MLNLSPAALKISQKGLILVSVPLGLGLAFVLALYLVLLQADRLTDLEGRARHASEVDVQMGQNVYAAAGLVALQMITGDRSVMKRYESISALIHESNGEMQQLLRDESEATMIIARNELLLKRIMSILAIFRASADAGESTRDMGSAIHLNHVREEMQSCIEQLLADMDMLNADIDAQLSRAHRQVQAVRQNLRALLAVAFVGNVVVSILLSTYFSKSIVKRLAVTQDNALRLTRSESLNPLLPGSDELADLDHTFHDMADILADTARKQRAIVDHAAAVICSIDRELKFSEISQSSEKLWGYQNSDLAGKSVLDILASDWGERTRTNLENAFSAGEEYLFENQLKRGDGETIDVSWSTIRSPRDQSLICVVHDITQVKQSEQLLQQNEERIRRMMERLAVGLVLVQPGGQIEYANPTFLAMAKLEQDQLIGASLIQLIPGAVLHSLIAAADSEPPMLALKHALKTEPEISVLQATGATFDADIKITELSVRNQPRLLATVRDVSDRREIERLKQELAAMISHDLRTPLTSLQGTLTLLQAGAFGPLTPEAVQTVAKAEIDIGSLIKLVGDLLHLEKLEAGQFKLVYTGARLADIIANAVATVRRKAGKRKILITSDTTSAMIECDPGQIEHVLAKLLEHAIGSSPDESTIQIGVVDSEETCKVSVSDQGSSLSEKDTAQIFQKFALTKWKLQTDEASAGKKSEEKEGMRTMPQAAELGLSISKAVIDQHGGTIGVVSEPGQGTTFWFVLPKFRAKSR